MASEVFPSFWSTTRRRSTFSFPAPARISQSSTCHDKHRKLMVELLRGLGFCIPVMPQGAFYVFADA
jgi:hypothetical protein